MDEKMNEGKWERLVTRSRSEGSESEKFHD